MFPLGPYNKDEVRGIALQNGLKNASKPDSQDICFVRGNYAAFILSHTGEYPEGDFLDTDGNVIGRHKGHIRYTIGQRKGLGMGFGKLMYVKEKDSEKNTVTLCEESGLYSGSFYADSFNWITGEPPKSPVKVKAKVRYSQNEESAVAEAVSDSRVHIEFEKPQRAITKGQAVVLYDGEYVLGGGTIN